MADGNRASADGKRRVGGGAQMGATHLYFDVDLENATSVQTRIRGERRGRISGASICRRGTRMTEEDG